VAAGLPHVIWLLMQTLRVLFSPAGIMAPRPFIAAVIAIYLAATASYTLTSADVIGRAGPWPFAAVQALLLWIWFALHARRLRDAGRSTAIAAVAAVLYAITLIVLVSISALLFSTGIPGDAQHNASGALGLILIAEIIAILAGNPHFDLSALMAAFLVALAIVPPVWAIAVTLYAATVRLSDDRSA
jgi:uncharacterized membrane protein YhaH (DUF805 family)